MTGEEKNSQLWVQLAFYLFRKLQSTPFDKPSWHLLFLVLMQMRSLKQWNGQLNNYILVGQCQLIGLQMESVYKVQTDFPVRCLPNQFIS